MRIELDMYQTMAVAVLALMLGRYLRKKCWLLERFCIPAPVIGGVIFAVATCICYVTGIAEFVFDDILKEVFMVFFFTSVGFQANLKVLKSGGKSMIVFLGLVIGLIVLQNGTAVGLAKFLHLDPLVGMCTGSDDGRTRYSGCVWSRAGGLRNFRGNDGLYGGSDVWPGGRQRDGRTARRTAG